MRPHRIINIEDLRLAARRRVPRVVFDYVDGGADGEITMRENVRAFEARLVPAALARSKRRSATCTTTVAGIPLSLPFLLAPIGSSRMLHPRGEEAGVGRGRRRRHRLHPVDVLRLPPGRRQGRVERAVPAAAVSRRRPRRLHIDDAAGAGRRLFGAGRHHRHRGRRAARARLPQRLPRAGGQADRPDAAVHGPVPRPPALARALPAGRRHDEVSERRPPRHRSDGLRRRRRVAREIGGHVGRLRLDPRRLARPDPDQGRAHRRRRPACGRRRRGRRDRVEPWRPSTRRRPGVAADAAGGPRLRSTAASKS